MLQLQMPHTKSCEIPPCCCWQCPQLVLFAGWNGRGQLPAGVTRVLADNAGHLMHVRALRTQALLRLT